ncbi:MAG: single-stranded DNA-binding protein [Rhodospirillaceae bacterium]|nr:single-stranded DNA-binding protein [Rhodospirillaceae bacterium]
MLTVNRATLVGHIGRDPEIRALPNGGKAATFSLATSEKWTDREGKPAEATDWHRSAVRTKKERKHELTQWLGRAGDRPVAETPPRPAKGAGRKGVAKFRRFPAAGRESCDLNCTGREPSLAGRATAGPMASDMRSMCLKPLYLVRNPRWPDGAEGSRPEPEGVDAAFWRVRCVHPDTGQPFYPVSPSRKG